MDALFHPMKIRSFTAELLTALAEQISKLEHHMSSQPLPIITQLEELIANHERPEKSRLSYFCSGAESPDVFVWR
jgi:hypothetical protein